MVSEDMGMHYEGFCIRPPSEAFSILLQVTVGCSHNKCTFCGTYKSKRFRIKEWDIVYQDILFASRYMKNQNRLFLMDGDALIIPQRKIVPLFDTINKHLPWLERIGTYANAKSLRKKTLNDLKLLREKKLGIIYLGVESGDDYVLKNINKGSHFSEYVELAKKVKEAGIKLSVTVLLGIGGKDRSLEHAKRTGELLTKMDPDYVGALTLMLIPGTPLYEDFENGKFQLPDKYGMLVELREMLKATELSSGLFTSNHASNYLPLKVKFPEQKKQAIEMIDKALRGDIGLKPEWMRAL